MVVNIHQLIAAINPDLYCDPEKKEDVKSVLREKKDYILAAEKAKSKETEWMDFDEITIANPFKKKGLKNPIERHILTYDSFNENLEPVYFWLLDTLNTEYKDMQKIDKLVDNFMSSVGSGHFSEAGIKATKMQEEAIKMLGAANQVIKSILNILYDLKEFQTRLKLYDRYNSKDKNDKSSALMSLKQLWMDTVDMKRGNSAIKAMAQQFQFVTLIDAFMAANSVEEVTKSVEKGGMDLNERVRRILEQRVGEFYDWIGSSEKELRKRYEIERIYLRSQVNTAQLYSRWVKPYLKAAGDLESGVMGYSVAHKATPAAQLVNAFNTAIFELVLLGESKYEVIEDTRKGDLPIVMLDIAKKCRKYEPIIVLELIFRSAPERAQQGGYGFRGRMEVSFTSYALSDEEVKILREQIQRDDLQDLVKLVEGVTTESLDKLKEELDEFLNDDAAKKEEEEKKSSSSDDNPFSALASIFSGGKKEEKKKGDFGISKDTDNEQVIRSQAIIKARQECRKMYDLYKKAHGMPGF